MDNFYIVRPESDPEAKPILVTLTSFEVKQLLIAFRRCNGSSTQKALNLKLFGMADPIAYSLTASEYFAALRITGAQDDGREGNGGGGSHDRLPTPDQPIKPKKPSGMKARMAAAGVS